MKVQVLCIVLLAGAAPAAVQRLIPSHPPTRPTPVPVARINGKTVTSERVELQLQGLIPRMSLHRNIKPERMAELRAQALDLAIDEELQYQEAIRLRVPVSDAEVSAGLERARKGYSSSAAFENARKDAGVTLAELRANVRRALLVQKVRQRAVLSACAVTDAEARRFYRDNPQRFVTPERLHVYVITVGVDPSSPTSQWKAARARAEGLLRDLQGGAKFEDVARRESSDESGNKGGDLGIIHRGRLTEEFENAVRDLRSGQMTPVIQTLRGFHILRLSEILPPEPRTYQQVRVQLVRDLSSRRCEDRLEAWRTSLRAKASIEMLKPQSTAAASRR